MRIVEKSKQTNIVAFEALQSNQKYPQQFDPGYGVARQCKSDYVASLVFIIHYGHCGRNVDMDKILYLLAEWDVEDCISIAMALHIRESYGQVEYARLWYEKF